MLQKKDKYIANLSYQQPDMSMEELALVADRQS